MMEQLKSVTLGLLVVLSLVQSYFLAYSMPSLEAKEKSGQDYVQTEPLGPEEEVKDLIFPELMVLHLGEDRHTVFYPDNAPYFKLILDKLTGRDFMSFKQESVNIVDWDTVRREDQGLELRFGRPVPFELLSQVFKVDGDFLFTRDSIDRIWIYVRKDSEEVRAFFFSSDGRTVYESVRADLTVGDVTANVGFGQYWTPYLTLDGELYLPEKNYNRVTRLEVPISRFTTEQMQSNLFFDPGMTRAIQERKDGQLIYTDGRRGLQVGEGGWMSYTNPAVPTEGETDVVGNVTDAVQFVNEHGGWNGPYRLAQSPEPESGSVVRFQQYFNEVPVVSGNHLTYGYMQLTLQKGVVTSYERSMLLLGDKPQKRSSRMLPGGELLRSMVARAASDDKVVSLFPAYRPSIEKEVMTLNPVWAVRLSGGEVRVVAESYATP